MIELDRPVWHALVKSGAEYSFGTTRALRFALDIGPLAACRDDDPASLADLATLVPKDGSIILLQAGNPPVPPGCRADFTAAAVQMTAQNGGMLGDPGDVEALSDADATEMLALAELTAPGPFAARTHRLGQFYGVRVGGRLVAMAGERMRFTGHAELSGVCTHPEHRGKGYAAMLCSKVVGGILARGEMPFLHAYAVNAGAIKLYEALGFAIRREMTVVKLVQA